MQASLSNLRISPRKVRLVANLVKGRTVKEALSNLNCLVKRSSQPIAKLINSAVANALTNANSNNSRTKIDKDSLVIKELRVDKGQVLKRQMPRAFGRASRINKRGSRVEVVLENKTHES